MPKVTVRKIGALGVIPDIPSHELPPEAWSLAENVGFEDGYAFRSLGETQVEGTPTVAPRYVFPSPSPVSSYWCYTDGAKIYAVAGGVHTEVTRASGDYTGGTGVRWNGAWLSGSMILNNGADLPQAWSPINIGSPYVDLPNWPSTLRAKVIRAYRSFLMALYITKNTDVYPTMVKWSQPADPQTVPDSWDETDPTKLTGEISLSDTPGFIVDGMPLGPSFMVYKEDSIIRMDRVASNDIFTARPISLRTGLMAQECAKEFIAGNHVAFTLDADVVVTDGQQVRGVTDKRVRRYLEQFVDGENRDKSFVITDQKTKQAFICYPRVGEDFCTEAAVWQWEDNTWSFKSLTDTLDIKAGIYDEGAESLIWDNDTQVWDDDTTAWDERLFVASSYKMIGGFPGVTQLREFYRGEKRGTTSYTSVLERTGLALAGVARDGSPVVDPTQVKQVTAVYPIVNTDFDMTLQVSVGAQDNPNGSITWDGPYTFDPAVDEKVDCFVEGRYIGIRFESASEVPWKMQGYSMDLDLVGEFY